MFKTFDPKKNPKNDNCDENNYFKNIIYFAGDDHTKFIKNVIGDYFGTAPIVSQISERTGFLGKKPEIRCITFDRPYTFFA